MPAPLRPDSLEVSQPRVEQQVEYALAQSQQQALYANDSEKVLNARSIRAFCKTAPAELRFMARLLTSLTLSFDKPQGFYFEWLGLADLDKVKATLGELKNLKELTITGIPRPVDDAEILETSTFRLTHFCTDLAFRSPAMLRFLQRNTHLRDLRLFFSRRQPKFDPNTPDDYCGPRVPNTVLRSLTNLHCGPSFLDFLVRHVPFLPPIVNLRLDLDEYKLLHGRTFEALSYFQETLVSLSVRFQFQERGPYHAGDIVNWFAESGDWDGLTFFELRGTVYSRVSSYYQLPVHIDIDDERLQEARKAFLGSIRHHFPNIKALIWVPFGTDPTDTHRLHPGRVATKFLVRCKSLRRFVFAGPDVDDIVPTRYAAYMRLSVNDLYVEGHMMRFEDTWRDGAVFFDRQDQQERIAMDAEGDY